MEDQNKILLTKVIENRLERALNDEGGEGDRLAFKEAMEAVSKQIELERVELSHEEAIAKMKIDEDKNFRDEMAAREKEQKDRMVQIGIFAAGLLAGPVIEVITKTIYANKICKLEQFETFTTSAGRGISSWFRFRK